jgi:Glycosyl transferases group 1
MRLFQNFGLTRAYAKRFTILNTAQRFLQQRDILLHDCYGGAHVLLPIVNRSPDAFFTSGDVEKMQRAWAQENGLPARTPLADILLAQIEHHRTEVFYNLDPGRFDGAIVRRLPAHVKRKIAWRAAPGKVDFGGYDLVVSNFPSIRQSYEEQGIRTAELFPAHDTALDDYARNENRDIDVLFFGGFSRYHSKRAGILEAVAKLNADYNVVFHLDNSRFTRLAETPLGWFGPLAKARRPEAIIKVAQPPVFGRAMYAELGRAKIVINAAIDMAGPDRGNMRCFEAMGGGALLLTDEGIYPKGMLDSRTMVTFNSVEEAVSRIKLYLQRETWGELARLGNDMIRTDYRRDVQFSKFLEFI